MQNSKQEDSQIINETEQGLRGILRARELLGSSSYQDQSYQWLVSIFIDQQMTHNDWGVRVSGDTEEFPECPKILERSILVINGLCFRI